VDLASIHLLAVVEIRPPGVQMLPFFSITEVTTKLQREGYIGFIIEMILYVLKLPESGLAAQNGKRVTPFLVDAL